MSIEIKQKYMKKNQCYTNAKLITVKGVMIHSTAGKEGEQVDSDYYFDRWNKPDIGKCVHAFLDEKDVTETLPVSKSKTYRAWHCGSGVNGSFNTTHIGFEIIEPKNYADKAYFEAVKNNALEYCAYLFKMYGWAKVTAENCLTHCEGHTVYKKASNHADIHHWWGVYHNYYMKDFRADLQILLDKKPSTNTTTTATTTTEKSETTSIIPSKKEVVKQFQSAMNTDYKCGLKIDGVYGTLSEKALSEHVIKTGAKANSVKWLQARLVELGYKDSKKKEIVVDGKYGTNTSYALKQFQKAMKLTADGCFGAKSMEKLLAKYK